MIKSIIKCLRLYSTFRGRASRKDYWSFALFRLLAVIAIVLILIVVTSLLPNSVDEDSETFIAYGIFFFLLSFLFVPSAAVLVRRLHDIGGSGWWYWISYIPLFGPIAVAVIGCVKSQPFDNKYGEYEY